MDNKNIVGTGACGHAMWKATAPHCRIKECHNYVGLVRK